MLPLPFMQERVDDELIGGWLTRLVVTMPSIPSVLS